jgi:hypothetical protein
MPTSSTTAPSSRANFLHICEIALFRKGVSPEENSHGFDGCFGISSKLGLQIRVELLIVEGVAEGLDGLYSAFYVEKFDHLRVPSLDSLPQDDE